MMQQETGGLKESEDGTVEPETPTDDEEVTIPSQDRNRSILDFPDNDIRDEQTLSNTQREDWLLPNEPMHGARPRQTGREGHEGSRRVLNIRQSRFVIVFRFTSLFRELM